MCTHVRVYTFSMCVHILNLVRVLNLDLSIVRILSVYLVFCVKFYKFKNSPYKQVLYDDSP